MKTTLLKILLALSLIASAGAQTPPPLEDQITTLWNQKKHAELRTLIEAKTSATPPDVVALYSAKFFYLFVDPDKAKAVEAASKLKVAAEATTNAGFIAFAIAELAEVQRIPVAEFKAATPEKLAFYHTTFPHKYPNIDLAVKLRRYIKP